MNKKKITILTSLILMLSALSFFWYSQAGSITFEWFSAGDPISSKYSMVHFAFPPDVNDYQWGIFWLPSIEYKSGQVLTYEWASYPNATRTCRKQVRWLYYNEQRGKRLWPMDSASLTYLKQINSDYDALTMTGGWYTTCSGWLAKMPGSDIYGQITFNDPTYWDTSLSAWLMYTINNEILWSPVGLFPSLAYYNNETPVGYLFDSLGGVWLVGWLFDGHTQLLSALTGDKGINDLFTGNTKSGICYRGACINTGSLDAWRDTAWYLSILGNTLLSRGWLDLEGRKSLIWNIGTKSAIMFTDLLNVSDILNELRRNASSLCVGKAWNSNDTEDSVTCINGDDSSEPLVVDLSVRSKYDKKDIIVKDRDVILQGTMYKDDDGNLPTLNIFIDKWNLYLQPDTPQFFTHQTWNYRQFDENALPVSLREAVTTGSLLATGTYGQLLRGNIFVNGLVLGFSGELTNLAPWIIPHKYYIYGRLASLNTALAPSDKRVTMISSMFPEDSDLVHYLSFSTDVFLWRCWFWSDASYGTDWTPCGLSWDPFKDSAFILIKEFIPTGLFQ